MECLPAFLDALDLEQCLFSMMADIIEGELGLQPGSETFENLKTYIDQLDRDVD